VSRRDNETSSQTRNYEVNKTREVFEKTQGEIEKLTASVLINYKQNIQVNEEGEETIVAEPYTEAEIAEFGSVVRTALGMSESRGDELTITQIQFHDPTAVDSYGIYNDQPTPWNEIFRWGLILATFFTIVALIMNIRKSMGQQQPEVAMSLPETPGKSLDELELTDEEKQSLEGMSEEEAEDFIDKKLTDKSRKQLEQKAYVMEEIKDFVELKPAEAAHVIRAMMTLEDE